MPVVATMTIIALLRSNASSELPFFDAALLREMLTEGLDGEPEKLLNEAMALVDELETLIGRYGASVESVIDAYIEASKDPRANAANLNKRVAALDEERGRLMRDIIRIRQELAEALTDEQWQAVFDYPFDRFTSLYSSRVIVGTRLIALPYTPTYQAQPF